jgi:PAS domain-containing protein
VQGALQDIRSVGGQAKPAVGGQPAADHAETISDGVVTFDANWPSLAINAQAERLLQRKRGALLNNGMWDEFGPGHAFRAVLRGPETRQPAHFRGVYAPLGLWLDISVYPIRERLGMCRDVTQRRADPQRTGAAGSRSRGSALC